MKLSSVLIFGIGIVCLLGSCTERRTASQPDPDGDTVKVVIIDPSSVPDPDAIDKAHEVY